MNPIINFAETSSNLQNVQIDDEIKIHEGRQYQILKAEMLLGIWQRTVSIIIAISLTILSAGLGLFSKSLRQLYSEAYYGRKHVCINVYTDSLPQPRVLEFDGKKNETIRALFPAIPVKSPIKKPKTGPVNLTVQDPQGTIKKTDDATTKVKDGTNINEPNIDSTTRSQTTRTVDEGGTTRFLSQRFAQPTPKWEAHSDSEQQVKNNGFVLESAPETVKNDIKMVLLAISQDGMAAEFASEHLKKDVRILQAVADKFGIKLSNIMEPLEETPEKVLPMLIAIQLAKTQPDSDGLYTPNQGGHLPGFILCDEGAFLLSDQTAFLCQKLMNAALLGSDDLCHYPQDIEKSFQALFKTPGFNEATLIKKFTSLMGSAPTEQLREKILPTLILIGNSLRVMRDKKLSLEKDVYFEENETIPFIIAKDGEVYLKGVKFAEGAFKQICECVALFGSEDVIWMTSSDKISPHARQPFVINKFNCPELADAITEENVLKQLHQLKIPHVPPLYKATAQTGDGIKTPVTYIRIQKRFYEASSLVKDAKPGQKLNLKAILKVGIDVALSLAELHLHKKVHSDVKPANILFDKNIQTGEVVEGILTDFGTVSEVGELLVGLSPIYSPADFIKEVDGEIELTGKKITPMQDSFNLGITLLHFITGSCEMQNKLQGPAFEKARKLQSGAKSYDDVLAKVLENQHLKDLKEVRDQKLIKKSKAQKNLFSLLDDKDKSIKQKKANEMGKQNVKQPHKYFYLAINALQMNKNLEATKAFFRHMNATDRKICEEIIDVCQYLTAGLKDEKTGERNIISCAKAAELLRKIFETHIK